MNPRYPGVAERASHRCEYCRAPEVIFNFPFEVEHVVPTSKGGDDGEANLALACRSCNLYKSDAVTELDPESNVETVLYNPRRGLWDEHFKWDPATGFIIGVSDAGRATVIRLRMNSPLQLAARRAWMKIRLYP